MPKSDFSKFDLQGIINSVKTMINPEIKVPEGDFIGEKVLKITELLKSASQANTQAADDLNKVKDLLSMLYSELEAFRKESTEKQAASVSPEVKATKTEEPAEGAEHREKPTKSESENVDKDKK